MARDISDLERDQWATAEAEEERRVLDFQMGRASWMTKTDLKPFAVTPWTTQPFGEVFTVIAGWGTVLSGERDEPERLSLAPGKVIGVDASEPYRIEAGNLGVIVVSFWEGRRAEKRYDRGR